MMACSFSLSSDRLCGVGFTMSLFIGMLAFDKAPAHYIVWLRSGVLLGSIASAVVGYSVLRATIVSDNQSLEVKP